LLALRADFPIFSRKIYDHPLVYLDSANTSQKPRQVVDAMMQFTYTHNANIARAMHTLGVEATAAYEEARAKIARFIGAEHAAEVVFTKNASESLNLAAYTLGATLKPGDEVVISVMEHHSNIVPWQLACQRSGAKLRWFDITTDGRLDIDKARSVNLINERTKVVSLAWVSNTLGTLNPIAALAAWAHQYGAVMVADGAQGVPQLPTDVNVLGVDMLAFTGHKMLGPTGIGVLWGRSSLLETLPPFLGGGEMIEVVRMESSSYAPPPHRFEAGTPPIVQAYGLGVAVDYLNSVGMENIARHEHAITAYALEQLRTVAGVNVIPPTTSDSRGTAVSFTLAGVHPHDLMQLLDGRGIAVRGGHHCARPLHERLGIQASTRLSSYLYTTTDEIDELVAGVVFARDFFAGKVR
jgi:cysteine desulfurase/selenocysteine lyase